MDLPQRPRKRARVACTWCHERKVRCDVSIRGSPCTNCQLDGHQCHLRSTANKGRAVGYYLPSTEIGAPNAVSTQPNVNNSLMAIDGGVSRPMEPFNQNPLMQENWQEKLSIDGLTGFNPQIPRNIIHPTDDPPPHQGSNVIFSFHRFLELKDLSGLPVEDVRYLEMKGCLHVPTGPVLDEFVRQYFLHVHPCLPAMNESDFWDLYNNRLDLSRRPPPISLFTFQAMLFTSCAFVPTCLIKSIGFPDRRTARNIFYNRAKLLFDLRAESDLLSRAQGAVLLTYQSSFLRRHAGTLWLTVAIQNAMSYGAHQYHRLSPDDPTRLTKKRLWWSVLLRDRILPLGVRRHLQITPQHFDLDLDCLDENDLLDEIHNSQVYNPRTKRSLALILNFQCRLALVLTVVIMTVYSPNSFTQPKKGTEPEFLRALDDLKSIRSSLHSWYEKAKVALSSTLCSDRAHESVTLYSNLTFIYYEAARAALAHYQVFTLETHPEHVQSQRHNLLEDIKNEIEDAALGTTKRVKHLLMRGIARNLPISAVAYTAFPLVLNALDAKFCESSTESASRKRLFRYYAEIMELYRKRYDGTDAVALCIQQMLQFVESHKLRISVYMDKLESNDTSNSKVANRNWADIFICQPRLYLRLSLTLDICMSRGYYPEDSDLPTLVREGPLQLGTQTSPDSMSQESPQEEPRVEPSEEADRPTINFQQQQQPQQPPQSQPQTQPQQTPHSPQQPTDFWMQMINDNPDGRRQSSTPRDNPFFSNNPRPFDDSTSPPAHPEMHPQGDPQPDLYHQGAVNGVNLDFLDLRNPGFGDGGDGGGAANHGGNPMGRQQQHESGVPEHTWPDAMLDEVLNTISA